MQEVIVIVILMMMITMVQSKTGCIWNNRSI
jgi:hypothetical protein